MRFFLFHPTYKFQSADMLGGHGAELKVELVPDNLYRIVPNKKWGINAYGFRDHGFLTQKHDGLKRICFLGDSFTMGLNVKSEETMPKRLEKMLKGFEVYNMGVVGFGPDQELNVLEKYGLKFKPDMVIQAICAQNDSDDIYKNELYDIDAHGKLQSTMTNEVKSLVFPSSLAILNQINFIRNRNHLVQHLDSLLFGDTYDLAWIKYQDSGEAGFKLSVMKAIFARIRDDLKKKNINFLGIIIPSYANICNDQYFKANNVPPDRYFINEQVYQMLYDALKMPDIDLVPFFAALPPEQRCALFDPGNGHLSPAGNLYAAKIIALYMKQHGID